MSRFLAKARGVSGSVVSSRTASSSSAYLACLTADESARHTALELTAFFGEGGARSVGKSFVSRQMSSSSHSSSPEGALLLTIFLFLGWPWRDSRSLEKLRAMFLTRRPSSSSSSSPPSRAALAEVVGRRSLDPASFDPPFTLLANDWRSSGKCRTSTYPESSLRFDDDDDARRSPSSLPPSGLVVALLSSYDPSVMIPAFSVPVLTEDVGLRSGKRFATSTTRKPSSYRFLPSSNDDPGFIPPFLIAPPLFAEDDMGRSPREFKSRNGPSSSSSSSSSRIDGVAFVSVFLAPPVFLAAPPSLLLLRFAERGSVVSSIPIEGVAFVIVGVFFFLLLLLLFAVLPMAVHSGILADLGRRSFISDFSLASKED
mmetsp:Transcript_14426/g.31064  ORF Transcript_14426/g.31064 Transcript_14426/m.31064 type:complete len:371 (-) Transcript_14426:339-1451(-)